MWYSAIILAATPRDCSIPMECGTVVMYFWMAGMALVMSIVDCKARAKCRAGSGSVVWPNLARIWHRCARPAAPERRSCGAGAERAGLRSEQRAQEVRRGLGNLLRRTLPIQRQEVGLLALGQDLRNPRGELTIESGAGDETTHLEAQSETSAVDVRSADGRELVVLHQGLGMQHGPLVLEDANSGLDQVPVVRARSPFHERHVGNARQDHAHVDPAPRRRAQCRHQRLTWNEVRRD